MALSVVTSYSFDPRAGTVTLTGVTTPVLEQIQSIRRNGVLIYSSSDARNASLSGKVLTLPKGAISGGGWTSADPLVITYGTISAKPGTKMVAPFGGSDGQVLTKTPSGYAWSNSNGGSGLREDPARPGVFLI